MKLLTWIVVANNSSARFFAAENQSAPLTEIEMITHSEGRLHDRDMTSDLPGRNQGECGTGGHAFEQSTDPKKHEAEQFAHSIAKHLETAHNEHKFKQLILVAEPSFLGLLRNQLSEQVKKMVCFELDNNIVNLTPVEIRAHLPEYLPHLH
ncbi:MAG: host attachment protein [Methylococcales bacterium]|nr:host attachment protein [Methylococcales bacterium]MDD5755038.1 host attachment protein [Methylococcales bacterium]